MAKESKNQKTGLEMSKTPMNPKIKNKSKIKDITRRMSAITKHI